MFPSLQPGTRKNRPGTELLAEYLYRPLAQTLVGPLAHLRIRPTQVVLFHTLLGLLAARQVARGGRLLPALLLQLKTVLDNADGQLARATGQTTATGRYLDSEMDLLVNAALLIAIDRRWGLPALGLLSLLLTADFLLEREYRAARGTPFRAPPLQDSDHPVVLGTLRSVYWLVFEPQERLLSQLFERRLLAAGGTDELRALYTPRAVTHLAANLGLSTQLALAGACIALGKPKAYLVSLPLQAAALITAQLWREARVRGAA